MIATKRSVGELPASVGRGEVRIKLDGFGELGDGPVILPWLVVGSAPVVAGQGILRVETDGLVVVLDGLLG